MLSYLYLLTAVGLYGVPACLALTLIMLTTYNYLTDDGMFIICPIAIA